MYSEWIFIKKHARIFDVGIERYHREKLLVIKHHAISLLCDSIFITDLHRKLNRFLIKTRFHFFSTNVNTVSNTVHENRKSIKKRKIEDEQSSSNQVPFLMVTGMEMANQNREEAAHTPMEIEDGSNVADASTVATMYGSDEVTINTSTEVGSSLRNHTEITSINTECRERGGREITIDITSAPIVFSKDNNEDSAFSNKRMYRSTDTVLLRTQSIKRPAQHSPGVPRKRLSTSSNDITTAEIVENRLAASSTKRDSFTEAIGLQERHPKSLNLASLTGEVNESDTRISIDEVDKFAVPKRPNHLDLLNATLPTAMVAGGFGGMSGMSGSITPNRLSLHRSISTKSFRNSKRNFIMRSLATTPTAPIFGPMTPTRTLKVGTEQREFLTPSLSRTKTLSMRHTASLNRTYSVRTSNRMPKLLRRLNSETGGGGGVGTPSRAESISQFLAVTNELKRTNSGFFKRKTYSSSTCTLAQTPTLRRNGSCRVVSSKVKRCQSTRVSFE